MADDDSDFFDGLDDQDDDFDHEVVGSDDADLGFIDDPHTSSKTHEYEREFSVHSVADIEQQMHQQVEQTSTVLGVQQREALPLLRVARWRQERLIEQYMEAPEPLLTAAKVKLGYTGPVLAVLPGFVCDICCMGEPDMQTMALACGHRFCVDCYRQYVDGTLFCFVSLCQQIACRQGSRGRVGDPVHGRKVHRAC